MGDIIWWWGERLFNTFTNTHTKYKRFKFLRIFVYEILQIFNLSHHQQNRIFNRLVFYECASCLISTWINVKQQSCTFFSVELHLYIHCQQQNQSKAQKTTFWRLLARNLQRFFFGLFIGCHWVQNLLNHKV